MAKRTHPASCHCGTVRLEADVDLDEPGSRCNCTFCTKLGTFTAHLKPADVRVTAGEAALTTYAFGAKTTTRSFCRHCGTQLFARGDAPDLGGAFASISLRALDDADPSVLPRQYWDGRHDQYDAPRSTPWPIDP